MRGIHKYNTSRIRQNITKQTHLQMVKTEARQAFSCSVLMGITWLFAVMAVKDMRFLFQTLFCIFNSLQGFFIFILHCARNPVVQKAWMEFFGFVIKDIQHPEGPHGANQNQLPSKMCFQFLLNT